MKEHARGAGAYNYVCGERQAAGRDVRLQEGQERKRERGALDYHISVSGASLSPKARASSGVRPFFRVLLTAGREKYHSLED